MSGPGASPAAAALWTLLAGLALALALLLLRRQQRPAPGSPAFASQEEAEEAEERRRDNAPPPPSSPSEPMRFVPLPFERRPEAAMRARARAFYEEMDRRRSVRSFSSEPIPEGVLDDVVRVRRRGG